MVITLDDIDDYDKVENKEDLVVDNNGEPSTVSSPPRPLQRVLLSSILSAVFQHII